MTRTKIVALLSVLALLAAMPLATVLAQQPVPPHKFYGMVMVNGETPPEGTMVSANIMVMMEGEDGEMMEETKQIGDGYDRRHGQLRHHHHGQRRVHRQGNHVHGHGRRDGVHGRHALHDDGRRHA